MDLLPTDVLSKLKEGAYTGCERNIRDDLSQNEQTILEKVKLLMNVLQTKCINVFCIGNYVSFLEGVLKEYDSITIVYACCDSDWYELLDPQTHIEMFMVGRGDSFVLKEEERCLRNDNKLDRLKCVLQFYDGTKFIVDLGKVTIYQVCLRANMIEIFSRINTNMCKVGLPNGSNKIFRWTRVDNNHKNKIHCYGSPFSLAWYCAKKLNIL